MKILHINYSDIKGGAAIASNQLHNNLINNGINSKILVLDKNLTDLNIIGPNNNFEILINNLRIKLARFFRRNFLISKNQETFSFNIFNTNLLSKINNFDCDIIHLHWIGNEMISISQIKKINKPIVWSFHDMWPITSGYHYTEDLNFLNLDSKEMNFFDKYLLKKKINNLNFKMNILCYSQWMYELVKKSKIFKTSKIIKIPYGIDLNFWKKKDTYLAKKKLGLNTKEKVLLFGSTSGTNTRKGFQYLVEAINKLKNKDFTLIIAGNKPSIIKKLNCDYIFYNNVDEPEKRRLIFAATDLTIMPSTLENFGLFALEAAACGVPSVIFEGTGTNDLIDHKLNGYVAKKENVEDLIRGIKWCLKDIDRQNSLSEQIRKKAKNFNQDTVLKKIIKLYSDVIN